MRCKVVRGLLASDFNHYITLNVRLDSNLTSTPKSSNSSLFGQINFNAYSTNLKLKKFKVFPNGSGREI